MKVYHIVFEEVHDDYQICPDRFVAANSMDEATRYGDSLLETWFGDRGATIPVDDVWVQDFDDRRRARFVSAMDVHRLPVVTPDGNFVIACVHVIRDTPKAYLFTTQLQGFGENEEVAWQDAVDGFIYDPPESPVDIEEIEEIS